MKNFYFLLLLIFAGLVPLSAQVSLTDGNSSVLIDFESSLSGVNQGAFVASGLSPSPATGQLDADAWAITGMSDGTHSFGQTHTSGDFARGQSNGGVGTGGLYSFATSSGNQSIGIQPTGSDFTPGTITLKIVNNQSSFVDDLTIDYKVYIRNDQDRSNSFNFSHSFDDLSYTDEAAGSISSAATRDASPSWVLQSKSIALTNLSLAPGAAFYLRWSGSDLAGSGSRDEFALDDIFIQASNATNNCTPPNAQASNLNFGTITSNSIQASFTLSDANNYLVLRSTNSSLNANPADGSTYTVGSSLGNGTVLQYGTSNQINATALQSATTYYFFVFATNDNCVGAPDYLTSNPLTASASTSSTGGTNYYAGVGNETCAALKTVLYNLIKDHTTVSYANLWTVYQSTDDRQNDAGNQTIVWDIYTDNPTGSETEYTFVSDQCGTYQAEGSCYNREHSFPKSWWGGATNVPMYTDIFTVIPVDGWINGVRNNNPYGEVQSGTETRITNNGSRLGSSSISIPGYTASVFEPIDAYKGDLARNYFYMMTRYENLISGWENFTTESDAVMDGSTYPGMESWAVDMFISWHNSDPVSQKEIDRNEEIFGIQGNRNPFIDHPEYVDLIWGSCGSDSQAPSAPQSLTASNITETTTDLSWTAATDNVGVTGYNIYQDGLNIGSISGTSTTISGLTASTAYTFYVTAFDAAGNESSASNSIGLTTASPPGGPMVLHEGYFESGWDGWQDGGSDCARYSGFYSSEGSYSIRIRDNSGTSSAMTSPVFDLSAFTSVEVSFSFYSRSMENNEDFWLRFYNGSSWTTVETYARGTDFQNNIFYTATVVLNSADYNFASNSQFRFQCDASGNNDRIYIDEVVISGDDAPAARRIDPGELVQIEGNQNQNEVFHEVLETELNSQKEFTTLSPLKLSVYPNPGSDWLNVTLQYREALQSLEIYNASGQLLQQLNQSQDTKHWLIDLSDFVNGYYFIQAIGQDQNSITQPFVVIH